MDVLVLAFSKETETRSVLADGDCRATFELKRDSCLKRDELNCPSQALCSESLHTMASEGKGPSKRLCFVTVGATASFNSLISATLHPLFLDAMSKSGYTNLLIQYGKDGKAVFEKLTAEIASADETDITIDGFDFNRDGLDQEMRAAKGKPPHSAEGVVISHAGKQAL
jgi:hypothetical protein